jgi:hypothetical protein
MDSQKPPLPETDPPGARSAAALRELHDRAQAAIATRRQKAASLEADITARLNAITAALDQHQHQDSRDSQPAAEAQAEIARLTTAMEDAQNAAKLERAAWESEREALEKERAAAETERATFKAERSAWETERNTFASERVAWDAQRLAEEKERTSSDIERAAWDTERNELIARLAKVEAEQRTAEVDMRTSQLELRTAQDQSRRQLAELEQKLLDERAVRERDDAERAAASSALERERDELRQKFELALEDVQRFRARVADLEQELARRPQANQADSAELVALRAERDALAKRIEDLERAPAVRVDADSEQQLSDLQRRFEMAVEDVRELKTKNAKLEHQLKDSKGHGGATSDVGGMDWESQKRRMLANLEGHGDDEDDPEAKKERATIQSTIEITDAVVAEKDQVIEELKVQLAAAGTKATEDSQRDDEIKAIVDTDEVIAAHRKNIAQIEQDLEAKLRAAELELSVERAKIARNRAELEELRIELESQRHAMGTGNGPVPVGTPKRRWLSKLGLTGDDEV